MQPKISNPGNTVILVVAIGVLLAFASALVPFFGAGYHLNVTILLTALTPYLIYAVSAPLLSRAVALGAGLLLLAAHGALVISERFLNGANYADGLMVAGPLVLAVVLLPLLVLVARKPY